MYSLFKTVETIQEIYSTCIVDDIVLRDYLQLKCNIATNMKVSCPGDINVITTEFMNFMTSNFNIQNCQYINSTTVFDINIIQSTVSNELDTLIKKELSINENICKIQMYFNDLIKKNEKPSKDLDYIKIHETDKTGISFFLTKKRSSVLKDILDLIKNDTLHITDETINKVSDIQLINIGANVQLVFPHLTTSSKLLANTQKK